jgi:hypothetical protein
VTTADTEILAALAAVERLPAGFPEVRCANPAIPLPEDFLDGARVVLCRILGGRRGWSDGFDALRADCRRRGIALLALGGEAEPDAEMTALSLAPAGAVAQAGEVPAPRRRRQRRATAALPGRHVPARGLGLRAAARGRGSRRLRRPDRRSRAPDDRRLLLPLALPDSEHGVRRRAV